MKTENRKGIRNPPEKRRIWWQKDEDVYVLHFGMMPSTVIATAVSSPLSDQWRVFWEIPLPTKASHDWLPLNLALEAATLIAEDWLAAAETPVAVDPFWEPEKGAS